jgi:hypothetical protein
MLVGKLEHSNRHGPHLAPDRDRRRYAPRRLSGHLGRHPDGPNPEAAWRSARSAELVLGVTFPSKPQQPAHRGLCSDLDECKRRFRAVWSGIHAGLSAEDIEAGRGVLNQSDRRPKFPRR